MSMQTRAFFDTPAVHNAVNPHSQFGYFHGPIPNANEGWVPPNRLATEHTAGRRADVRMNDNSEPPNPAARMSGINTNVCDIEVAGQMCGVPCKDQPTLRRHIRNTHPGALTNPGTTNIQVLEAGLGQNAIKKWVLTKGWRNAVYIKDPGRGPVNSLAYQYAEALEAIARDDDEFRQEYGGEFQREPITATTRERALPQRRALSQVDSNSFIVAVRPPPAEHMQPVSGPSEKTVDKSHPAPAQPTPRTHHARPQKRPQPKALTNTLPQDPPAANTRGSSKRQAQDPPAATTSGSSKRQRGNGGRNFSDDIPSKRKKAQPKKTGSTGTLKSTRQSARNPTVVLGDPYDLPEDT